MRGRRAADLEDLGLVTGVDVVAGCGTGIACNDGEIGARDSKSRAAIISISMFLLVYVLETSLGSPTGRIQPACVHLLLLLGLG